MLPLIDFEFVRVTPINLHEVRVEWKLFLTPADLSGYAFRLLRSGAESGPFEVVVDGIPSSCLTTVAADMEMKLGHKVIFPIWRVEIYKIDGSWSKMSRSETIGHRYDQVCRAVMAKEHLALTNPHKGIGVRCMLFTMRQWGPRCPACWDQHKQKMTKSNCTTCFNTGFTGGYYYPIEIWINFRPPNRGSRMQETGAIEFDQEQGWTLAVPSINHNDVIVVCDTDERYQVITSQPTVRRRAEIRQMLDMKKINKGNIEYQLKWRT